MNNIKALQWRYATKKFDKLRILPEEKLAVLKNAFNLTATSYGLQPIRLAIISDKKIQKKLVEFSLNQHQVGTASHVLVICIEQKVDKSFIEEYFRRVQHIRSTPDEIINPFKEFLVRDFGKKDRKDISEWATNQAYLALGTLMTVCATEEIDGCPMEGFEPEKYAELLGLKQMNLQPVLVLPVGYRAKDDMFSEFKKVRRPLSEVIIEL